MSLRHQILLDSPVGYWPLDETSGTNADNLGSATADGTYTGGYTLDQAGPAGLRAVELNGSTGYVSIGDVAALEFSGDFTMEAWISRDDITGGDKRIVGKHSGTSGEWRLDTDTDDIRAYVLNTGGTNYLFADSVSTGAALVVGRWTHVAATVASTTLRVYVNGDEWASSSSTTGTRRTSSTDPVRIGIRGDGNSTTAMDGKVAHVAVYGSALSADRLKAHYQAGIRSGVAR